MESNSAQGFTTRMLARCSDGQDAEAWQELANVVWGYVSCAARGFTREDLEDMVQLVLLRVSRSLPLFKRASTGSLRAWLRVIARNVTRTEAKRPGRFRQTSAVIPELLISEEDPAERLIEAEAEALFKETKATVAAKCPGAWKVFELLHPQDGADQRPAAEVARELAINVSAVWKANSRIHTSLTEELKRRLDEEE